MSKKILVVDDDAGILDAMKVMLEIAGYKVQTSADGEVFNKLNIKNLPDIILLDVLLSGVDGRDICRKLKKNRETRQIPIIMFSAHPSAKSDVDNSGADDFISKPFSMNDLLDKIENRLSNLKN